MDINGNPSTYSLAYTTRQAYNGGVLAPDGSIHFIPKYASVGQKIDINGNVSTYSYAFTTDWACGGGILAPNGDIHFIPTFMYAMGQKIARNGTVSTYSVPWTAQGKCLGGVLNERGDALLVPYAAGAVFAGRMSFLSGSPPSRAACCSSWINKF